MRILGKIKMYVLSKIIRVSRYINTVVVTVNVTSPFYDANATSYIVWFNRYEVEVENIKVPLDEHYHVDLDYILQRIPAHIVQIKYPKDWEDTIDNIRAEQRRNKHWKAEKL